MIVAAELITGGNERHSREPKATTDYTLSFPLATACRESSAVPRSHVASVEPYVPGRYSPYHRPDLD